MVEFRDRVAGSWRQIVKLLAVVAPYFRNYGRTAMFLIAGLIIPFMEDHGNLVGLQWVTAIGVVSLAARDDVSTSAARALWRFNVLFTVGAVFALWFGTVSATSALSLTVAQILFETARGFTRRDRIVGWGSAALAAVLTITIYPTQGDSRFATGAIGAWAIILGVFAAIRQSETLMNSGKKAISRVTKR